ncbi:MAG: N-acetylneuraminate synthase family protein [Phycisphaeraceae bacterium]|nr:N-acetylneuraminate synthase family protein [Phycisphaeraceae bacterium]
MAISVDPNATAHWFAPADGRFAPRVMVTAEIGVNHDGNLQRALELTRAAADAGADAVKLQLFDPRTLLSQDAELAAYQISQGDTDPFSMLDRLKLRLEQMQHLRAEAHARGLAFIVTPFSVENIAELRQLQVDMVKIASPDAVNVPLLDAAASLGRPMLISTGTCVLEELNHAVNLIRELGGCLLQCVSSYPTAPQHAAINAMVALRRAFHVPVGYSDHTTDQMTGALAVAAGACVIEKHLTYDCHAVGPDHAASFEPTSFAAYVSHIRVAARMLGPISKQSHAADQEVRRLCRQSVCAARPLRKGQVLTRDDLTVRRPGTGIPAADLQQVIGRTLQRDIDLGRLLQEDDLTD